MSEIEKVADAQSLKNEVLDRVLSEVRTAQTSDSEMPTTKHQTYVSGIFETPIVGSENSEVLDRVLQDVRNAEASTSQTTAHSTYVSGIFEELGD